MNALSHTKVGHVSTSPYPPSPNVHSNTCKEEKRGLFGKLVGTNGVLDAIYGAGNI